MTEVILGVIAAASFTLYLMRRASRLRAEDDSY